MKRTALVLSLLALVVIPAAQAHSYFHRTPAREAKLEERINHFRANHSIPYLLPSLRAMAATIALQKANYQEHQWTLKIEGAPYSVWSTTLFPPPAVSTMATSIRPHGAPWTPRQVVRRWKHKSLYRWAMLFPGFSQIGVRAGYVHQHKGEYKGKGRSTVYYVSFGGSGL